MIGFEREAVILNSEPDMPDTRRLEVVHYPRQRRYVVELDGHTAFLQYRQMGASFVITHTEVPPEFEGKGIGGALVKAVLDEVRDQDFVVVPLCPFVRSYIRKHPEYLDIVGFGERGDRLA